MLAETPIKQKSITSVCFFTSTDAITLGSERPIFHLNEMIYKRNEDERIRPFRKTGSSESQEGVERQRREVGCSVRAGRGVCWYSAG